MTTQRPCMDKWAYNINEWIDNLTKLLFSLGGGGIQTSFEFVDVHKKMKTHLLMLKLKGFN